jgi:two-component system KDP operon response regulator KdpE
MSQARATILVVDDEPQIRRMLRTSLAAQGYKIDEAETGAAALVAVRRKPDLIILDLGLPDMDGIEVIREIRAANSVPIIVLSSRDDEAGKVTALDLAADDYVTKPFGMAELTARVRTALRHRLHEQGVAPIINCGALSIDLVHRRIMLAEIEIKLSPKEYDLLALLAQHSGRVLTHRQILREVWGPAQENDIQYLRVFIRALRQKIEPAPAQPRYVLTESGVGYRLVDTDT